MPSSIIHIYLAKCKALMLLDVVLKNSETIFKHSKRIKILLLFAMLYLLNLTKSKNDVHTHEALHAKMEQIDTLHVDSEVEFHREGENEVFTLNDMSPNMTILIYGKKADKRQFAHLMYSVQKAKVITKNIKVVLADRNPVNERVQYFCTIKLNFGNTCNTTIFPFNNQQPNSDLLFISTTYFPPKASYRPFFRNTCLNNVNNLEICITQSLDDNLKFLLFIRALQNLHSHSLGSYFYIPFADFNISALCFAPFIAANLIYCIFASFSQKKFASIAKLGLALSYLYSPLFLVFFVAQDCSTNACCMLFFVFVNFRFGFIYALLVFVKNFIVDVVLD
jgi:hypothetical protein